MLYESQVVDEIIYSIQDELIRAEKHLIKTSTIMSRAQRRIDISDPDEGRQRLLLTGMRQVIQQRLWAAGYASLGYQIWVDAEGNERKESGYFVHVKTCTNQDYLEMIKTNKTINSEGRRTVIDQIRELAEPHFIPDENNVIYIGTLKQEDIIDLEADAI